MPLVMTVGRFKFSFYSNERNEPPHIHIIAGDSRTEYWLDPVEYQWAKGFHERDLSRIEEILEMYQEEFLEAWHVHFGP
jgi:hypothetical protein